MVTHLKPDANVPDEAQPDSMFVLSNGGCKASVESANQIMNKRAEVGPLFCVGKSK